MSKKDVVIASGPFPGPRIGSCKLLLKFFVAFSSTIAFSTAPALLPDLIVSIVIQI